MDFVPWMISLGVLIIFLAKGMQGLATHKFDWIWQS